MQEHEVTKRFDSGDIFKADIAELQECLACISVTEKQGPKYPEMAETIRHLIFLHQTKQAHNDSMKIARIAIAVAAISAFAAAFAVFGKQ